MNFETVCGNRRGRTLALIVATMIVTGQPAAGASGQLAATTCTPSLTPAAAFPSEGHPTPAAMTMIRSRGTLRAKVIFVDFSDAPATADAAKLASGWMTAGTRYATTSSYGRVRIQLDPEARWLRMPRTAASYRFGSGLTYELHRSYIADAIAAADATVDFSSADLLYVVSAENAAMRGSQAFHGLPGVFTPDGRELRAVVTFGEGATQWGRTVLPHETGHLFTLPDLYAYAATNQHRYVGVWDYMGNVFQATDLVAWHKLRIGWLDSAQFACAKPTGISQAALTPIGSSGGRKAMFIRTGTRTALLVENRQRVGLDRGICRPGLLVYSVSTSVRTGQGPIRVLGGTPGTGCGYGPRSDATLRTGQRLVVGRTTIEALAGPGLSRTVRVTRR